MVQDENKPILSEVFNHVADLKAGSVKAAKEEAKPVTDSDDEGLGVTALLLGSGAITLLAIMVIRRFRSSRSSKKGKMF